MVIGSIGRARVSAVFDEIDVDNSGTISTGELEAACKALSITVTAEDINSFMEADSSGDGLLDLEEFCKFYESRLRVVFDSLDIDGNGSISVNELKTACSKLGYSLNNRQLQILLSQVDTDRNGLVDFNEFCDYFSSLPSPNVTLIIEQWASGLGVDTGTDLAPPSLPPPAVSIWQALFAGGVAGCVSRTVTAPLEKIKLLAQTSTATKSYNGVGPTIMKIIRTERIRGLFSGNGVNCLRIVPFSGLVCLAYSTLAKRFPLDNGSMGSAITGRMLAGLAAGVFATTLTHPMDVVRANLTGIINTGSLLWSTHGVRGLYRGLVPTLVAIGPFIAIQQSSYDSLKYMSTTYGIKPSPSLYLLCGSIAGITAQTVVYPLDVIRRQMQVHSVLSNPWTVAKDLFVKNKLFVGLVPTYMKVIPSVAVSLIVRDALLGRLKR